MPQVPYQGYPTDRLQDIPLRVDTPGEAFGVGAAQAIAQGGREVSGAGTELFNRAVAMKQLENETEAEQANLQLMSEAGDLHAAYNALQGGERYRAFPKYKSDLLATQARIRSGLSNDMARRMFDRPALNTVGHSIFNGAGAAATAQKDWVKTTASSTMDMAIKTISDDPLNDNLWEEQKQRIKAAGIQIAQVSHGAGPNTPIAEDIIAKGISSAARERIIAVSHVDPWRAGEMQAEALKKKDLMGPDSLAVDNAIRSQRRSIGATNIADGVYEAGKKAGRTLEEMENEVRQKWDEQFPDDKVGKSHAVSAVQHNFNQDKYATTIEQRTNEQIVLQRIQSGVKNEQEFMADPAAKRAYDALLPSSPYKKTPLSFQVRAYKNKEEADEMDANWRQLRALASNDTIAFLNTRLDSVKLNKGDYDKAMTLRDRIIKGQNTDPRIGPAMTTLRAAVGSQLEALQIFKRTDANKTDYDHFTGTLQSALDAWVETHGKPPTSKDLVDTIWPQIAQQRSFPGRFYGKNEYPVYRAPTYTKEYTDFDQKLRADMADKGRQLTDEEVYRAYTQALYNKFYRKTLDAK